MKTIAITYSKGGVGKTATAVNTAAVLADEGFRVLLIDLDPQGCATANFPIKNDMETFPTAFELLTGESEPSEAIVHTSIKGLDLIGAEYRLSKINDFLYDPEQCPKDIAQYILKDRLEAVKDNYDFCLLDCLPSDDMIKKNALSAANYVVLPAIADDYALTGLEYLSKELAEVKRTTNPALSVLGVLFTMNENTAVKKAYTDALSNGQNIFPVFQQTIRKCSKIPEALNHQKPVVHYRCTAGRDYVAFTYELLTWLGYSGYTADKLKKQQLFQPYLLMSHKGRR